MKKTRILSWILVLAMILSLCPAGVFAVDSTESETTQTTGTDTNLETGASDSAITGWQSYNGSTWVTYSNRAMHVTSKTNPGTVFFSDRKFENYEMEVEMQLNSGPWFGVMYRAIGDEKGFFYVRPGSGAHTLSHHITKDGDGWQSDSVGATAGYSQYTTGTVMKFKVRVENNYVSVWTKMSTDSDYILEIDNVAVPQALQGEGYVGICMQVASTTVYSVSINDLDSDYTYTSDFAPLCTYEGEWGFDKGSGSPAIEEGILKPNISTYDTLYKYKDVSWSNMVLETEFSYTGNYAGVVFRGNGPYNACYLLSGTNTSERIFRYYYQKDQTTALAGTTLLDNVQGSTYTYGDRIKLRITVKDNVVTIEEMIVGVDTDWVKTVDSFSLTDNASMLGTAGEIGFYSRKGADLTIYNLKVTDTDTGYCYKAIDPGTAGSWGFYRGSGSPTIEDGVLKPGITTYQTLYMYRYASWENYVMEAEYSYTGQYAGVVIRGYNSHYAYYCTSKAGASTNRSVKWFKNDSSATTNNMVIPTGSDYVYGNRIKVRATMQDNKLTVEEMIVGVDTDWVKTVDNLDISNFDVLGTSGMVGLYTRTGSNLTVYNYKMTDTDTGLTYDLLATEQTESTDSVVFDGNHIIDTSAPLTQTPDTIELWFKTENGAAQALLSNAWNGNKPNEMYLTITAAGRLYYFEDNPDSQMGEHVDVRLESATGFNDGNWHKAVIRRYYDDAKGLFKVDLSVYTDGKLVDRATQTNVIGDTKKEQYTENGNEFVSNRILQIGTKNDNRYVFTGEIGEIRMWDHALSDEEIASGRISLDGTEEGLLHCFVPEDGTNFVDLVTSQKGNEITADMAELWMENYVIGDADWRIAVLPDVQHITESYEINMRKYFAWIRDNAEAYNIKMVISIGDMVNTCTPEQMHIVSEASSILDGVVPFMPLMGNHDYPTYGRDYVLWNEYFPYEKYSQYDYFGGAYEEGRMDNYYYLLNIHGEDYLFMGLELAVRPAVAQWANEVIAAHPDHKVIIANHAYLDGHPHKCLVTEK